MIPTDEQLMLAYIDGDHNAFRAIFDRHATLLMRLMRKGISREVEAQDLVQQTFLQLHRARNDFRRDSKLRPWLVTIALNLKREFLRSSKRKPETLVADHPTAESKTPKDPVELKQNAAILRAALRQLPDNQREVIELYWFKEMSFPEVAKEMGLGLSAVKVRAHRGYQQLKAILANTTER